MATRALDVVTILHALRMLDGELLTTGWKGTNSPQWLIFSWLKQYDEQLSAITGLEGKTSRFWEELNTFLTERGFEATVRPFNPNREIGVVSVLDKLVHWLAGEGEIVDITTTQGTKPGFELPPSGVKVYEVPAYQGSYLLELLTRSGDTLWLFVHDDISLDGLFMVNLARKVMNYSRRFSGFAGAQVPMLDFYVKPDISWLVFAEITTKSGQTYDITQAKQQFKMRMDETGARVKVATAMMARSLGAKPSKFIVNRPFYGWFTQRGVDLPMAVFFADWDAMKKPSGSLQEL